MDYTQIIGDFTRRYSQSWLFVKFPDSEEENLFYVESITPEDTERLATISLHSPDYGRIKLNYGTNHTFKFRRPKAGVFQFGKDAYIYWRRPERQYKHGICNGNSIFRGVHVAISRDGDYNLGSSEQDYNLVKAAFNPKTYSFKEARNMLATGKYRSVALNAGFALMLNVMPDPDNYLLMFYDRPVAAVSVKDGSINKILDNAMKVHIENGEYL